VSRGALLESLEFRAVGTVCAAAVTAFPGDRRRARRALDAAVSEVAACERALSRFDRASDLSRLNAAGGEWTPVDRRLVEALRLALRAREDTGGRFDPTILPALAAAGYDRSFEQLPTGAAARPAERADGWRAGAAIELDETAGAVRLEPGAAVDLGGIGKGYAAMRALDAMTEAWPGLPGGLVDLGGDLELRGATPDGGPWRVAVADARRPDTTLGMLLVAGGGVATSGRDVRRFGPGGSLHHLIDPATGEPARPGPLAVTVVAPDAATAEVHATTLGLLDADAAAAHIAARPRISALYLPVAGEPLELGTLRLARTRFVVRAA
jgi:thiamine biosynthesis lipoprotein